MISHSPRRRTVCICILGVVSAHAAAPCCPAQQPIFTPFNKNDIYQVGETAGWNVTLPRFTPAPAGDFTYKIKTNNAEVIKTDKFDLSSSKATIEVQIDHPAMLYAEVTPPTG